MEVLPDTPGGKISGKSILICAESRVLKGCVMEMKSANSRCQRTSWLNQFDRVSATFPRLRPNRLA
jgi:hypothetical protein